MAFFFSFARGPKHIGGFTQFLNPLPRFREFQGSPKVGPSPPPRLGHIEGVPWGVMGAGVCPNTMWPDPPPTQPSPAHPQGPKQHSQRGGGGLIGTSTHGL